MYRIGDFLIQIKNAYQAGKKQIDYPYSKVAESIGKILVREKYIAKISVATAEGAKKSKNGDVRKTLKLELRYEGRIPAVTSVKLVSKPSVHHYVAKNKLSRTVSSHGIAIISTSAGMMTNREAQKKGVGGELVCRIF